MDASLVLNLDVDVLKNAEFYAKTIQKTVPQLVEDYLMSISPVTHIDGKPLGPITSQLAGIIKLDKNTSYKVLLEDALLEKYF